VALLALAHQEAAQEAPTIMELLAVPTLEAEAEAEVRYLLLSTLAETVRLVL
jgi:hypothetical protein